ncbi:polysaccharide deacetylase family protein [Uliginosibacterium sp. H1]|uniref:polysaccharide deacetylase family protein n=1 Tax=Uliginosibacterium sp. H1 TaxID=3114757 RepID=UPI002E17A456|nr:polysaccharide deacetylase family protein [Uliginosibacterium sp. H1]
MTAPRSPRLNFPLREHGRYPYSPIVERPDFNWPNGKRLAVYIALNLEHYAFDEGMREDLVPNMPSPDVLNHSWREYGNRVGAWRLLDVLRAHQLPVSLLVNSELYAACPQLVTAFRDYGAEIAAHGRTNSEHQADFSEGEERELIEEVTHTIALHEGVAPRGWLSPWIAETLRTPELLQQAGYRYIMDWCMDDQPVWLRTHNGPLLALPYPQEINDSAAIMGRQVSASEFADMIVDQFDELLAQSAEQPLTMGIALHAMIIGQPFRLRHLRRALAHIAQHREACWVTTAEQIAAHFAQQVPATR